jgi:hypothetical protein
MMARNTNLGVVEEEEKKSSRSVPPQQENSHGEFDATVRNNYLNETKSSFHPERTRSEPLRAKITNQILSPTREKEMQKFSQVISGNDEGILKEEGAVGKLSAVYPGGVLMGERSL